jgi:nucleoside 2-deoxyribosyltransferase
MKIYLSGNMTPSADYYEKWTSMFSDYLEKFDTPYKCSISKLKDPTDGKFIVHHDLARLKRCDILVANLSVTDTSHHLTGAIVEIYEAYKQNKPVYVYYSTENPRSEQAGSSWIQQFVTREFNDIIELFDFLIHEENV